MIVYLDTSVVLRILFREAKPLRGWGSWEEACTSDLMSAEARRAIDRMRLDAALVDEQVADLQQQLREVEIRLRRVMIDRRILERAAQPMATSVRTLDAIHLATALLFQAERRKPLVFATHDQRQALAARALGFECLGSA